MIPFRVLSNKHHYKHSYRTFMQHKMIAAEEEH